MLGTGTGTGSAGVRPLVSSPSIREMDSAGPQCDALRERTTRVPPWRDHSNAPAVGAAGASPSALNIAPEQHDAAGLAAGGMTTYPNDAWSGIRAFTGPFTRLEQQRLGRARIA